MREGLVLTIESIYVHVSGSLRCLTGRAVDTAASTVYLGKELAR
jgi:hypothetical protein